MKLKCLLLFAGLSFCLTQFAQKKIVILHTNDTHSRIEPLPDTDKYNPGWGGVVNRLAVIDSIRTKNENVLLFDVGDFVQGTPYFNLFKGRVEVEAMNSMRYDAGTIGNHEFDYGLDTLYAIIKGLNFPVVSCNYDFSHTKLNKLVKPYVIVKKFGLKIGVIGVGADPEGLIQKEKYEGMIFRPAIQMVDQYSQKLKKIDNCDLVICLSHLGYSEDIILARQTYCVDIILGGHSHTFMEAPEVVTNRSGNEVTVFQVGKNGVYLGKIEVELNKM